MLGIVILGYVAAGPGRGGGGTLLISLLLLAAGLVRARRDPKQAAIAGKIASRTLMLVPGAMLVSFSFHAGGFFPQSPAIVAVLLALILAAKLLRGQDVPGNDRLAAAITIAFVAYAAWALASGKWSGAPERGLIATDYVLVYGLGLVLFATSVRDSRDMRWVMRGLALGSFLVCLSAFLSRALPTFLAIPPSLDTQRLSYPLGYWNALGLLAALGIVLCVGLTCDDREPRVLKAVTALAVPLLAVTLLLTFSRGAIGAGAVGLVVYVLIGRPRSLLTAAIAVGPTTAIALNVAYNATSLHQTLNGSAVQTSEGHHLALVLAVCMLAAGAGRWLLSGLDPRLLRLGASRPPVGPNVARGLWATAIGLAVAAALILGLPSAVTTEYDRFAHDYIGPGHTQLRDRLTEVRSDGRITLWQIALNEFDDSRVKGTGAGTYAVAFDAHRSATGGQVLNAHSIYFESLGELGVIGFALLVCIVLGSLVAIGRRVRKPERTLYAAAFAAALVWAIHAGFDWDWQMPAVTLPAFVLAGAALGRAAPPHGSRRRPLLALGVLVAAIAPALVSVSQSHLDAGVRAFEQDDCATATTEASRSLEPLSFRRGAHEILGYCDAARGDRGGALAEMTSAVGDDPTSWEPLYGLAVVRAASGRDPRPALRIARALNPYEPVINTLAAKFVKDRGTRSWAIDAVAAPLPVDGQYGGVLAAMRAGARGRSSR